MLAETLNDAEALHRAIKDYEDRMLNAPLRRTLHVPFQLVSGNTETLVGRAAAYHAPSEKVFVATNKTFYLLSAASGYTHWSIKASAATRFSSRFDTHCMFLECAWNSAAKLIVAVVQFSPKTAAYSMTFLDAGSAAFVNAFVVHHSEEVVRRFDAAGSVIFASHQTAQRRMHTAICAGNTLFSAWCDLTSCTPDAAASTTIEWPHGAVCAMRRVVPAAADEDVPSAVASLFLLQTAAETAEGESVQWLVNFADGAIFQVPALRCVTVEFAVFCVRTLACVAVDDAGNFVAWKLPLSR